MTDSRNSQPDSTTPSGAETGIPLAKTAIPLASPVLGPEGHGPGLTHPMLLKKQTVEQTVVDLVIVVGVAAGCLFVLAGLVKVLGLASDDPAIDLMGMFVWGALVVVAIAAALRVRGRRLAAIGLTTSALRANLLLGLPVTLLAFVAFFVTIGLIWAFWPAGYRDLMNNPENIRQLIPEMHPLLLLAGLVWVGIYEEILFRGFLLAYLRRLTSSWPGAIVLSSAAFALLHLPGQPVAACLTLFSVAVVLALVTIWRKSLMPAIVGHALFNFTQLMFLFHS